MTIHAATFSGNLAADPELRFTASGLAVANFTVACTPRSKDAATGQYSDDETLWVRCTVWRGLAERVSGLRRGDRVLVTGRLRSRSFDTRDGDRRTVWELDADEVGASLMFAPVRVERVERAAAVPV